jgi:hypothetical protein
MCCGTSLWRRSRRPARPRRAPGPHDAAAGVDDSAEVSYDKQLWAELTLLRFLADAYNVLVSARSSSDRPDIRIERVPPPALRCVLVLHVTAHEGVAELAPGHRVGGHEAVAAFVGEAGCRGPGR